METKKIKVADVIPYEGNAKKHDEKQIKNVMESIKQFGFVQPIVVDADNGLIIGHCRLIAAKRLKMKTIDAVIADNLTPEQVDKLRLLDNKLNESEWDINLLTAEIPELDFSDFDIDWGFEDVNADDFGDSFSLADGEKNPICQMTLTLHEKQKELLEWAMQNCGECTETFGNTNKQGNAIYEVVKQWADARK